MIKYLQQCEREKTLIYIGFIIITGRLKTVIKDSYLREVTI